MKPVVFNYSDIEPEEIEKDFHIGEFADGDVFRETINIPTFKGQKLRFESPWLNSSFDWGLYNTLTLTSRSTSLFPHYNKDEIHRFRIFLNTITNKVQKWVDVQPNPDFLNTRVISPVEYKEQYSIFQFRIPIQKKFFDANGEFEGLVLKTTNIQENLMTRSSITEIKKNSYLKFIGYIGKVYQTKNSTRYRINVEQIHWVPSILYDQRIQEEELLTTDYNMFMNTPMLLNDRKVSLSMSGLSDSESDLEDEPVVKKIKL